MSDTLSSRVKQARIDRHMSIRALSRESGVAVGTIRRIEAGRPTYDYILSKLASALDISFSDLEGVA